MTIWTRRRLLGTLTVLPAGLPANGHAAPMFTGHTLIKSIIQSGQTAICDVADFGTVQILVLVVNGTVTEVHARRKGIYQAKQATRSYSQRAIAPVDYNRLITAAGGLGQTVNGTARATSFFKIYQTVGSDTAGTAGSIGNNQRFDIATDPFFALWTFDYDARSHTFGFDAPGIRAVWTLEGQP